MERLDYGSWPNRTFAQKCPLLLQYKAMNNTIYKAVTATVRLLHSPVQIFKYN